MSQDSLQQSLSDLTAVLREEEEDKEKDGGEAEEMRVISWPLSYLVSHDAHMTLIIPDKEK